MYAIVLNVCTKFEQNRLRDVWIMAQRDDKIATKWPPGGHIGSYCEINWCEYVCHSAIALYQVWTKLVQGCLNYGSKTWKNRNKMAARRPYWIVSWNKLTCICMPQCNSFAPSLNKIGSGTFELWLKHMKKLQQNGRQVAILDRIAK